MKIIDTDKAVDPNKLQPFSTRSLSFLQRGIQENYRYIASAIVGPSYDRNTPYVIDGCVLSNANKDITNGHIFYKEGIYTVHGMTGSTGTPIRFLETLTPDATADPTTFSDGTIENVHIDHDYNALDSATVTYDFSATDLVYLNSQSTLVKLHSSTTSLAVSSTPTAIKMPTVDRNVNSWYNSSTGVFTPSKAGWYELHMNILFNSTTNIYDFTLYKNGSSSEVLQNGFNIDNVTRSIYTTCFLANGSSDYFSVNITALSSLTLNHTGIMTFKFVENP